MFSLLLLALATHAQLDSTRWVVLNHGRVAGDLVVKRRSDSLAIRYVFTDRNRGTRSETRYGLDARGQRSGGRIYTVQQDGTLGAITQQFDVQGDSLVSRSGARTRLEPGTWRGVLSNPFDVAEAARHLLTLPKQSGALLYVGNAHAEVVADTTVRVGARRQRARLVMLTFAGTNTASGVWLDERGKLLATDVQWFMTVAEQMVPVLPTFRAIELRWRAKQAEAVATSVRTPTADVVVLRGGDVFDSESGTLRARQSVLLRGGRIERVGSVDSVAVPEGATVIEAAGKTILPGLWDMHTHLQVSNQSSGSLMQLAFGLTTVRDLAADVDVAVSHRDRERAGRLASPRVILGGFIEGPLKWAGPSEALVSTEREAVSWVQRYDSLGYKQIKLYNVLHPDLIPAIATEAKRHGMKLSGHIPRGISVRGAVALGFDEIQHAAFLLSDFFQDSLYTPTMRAYSAVATAVAPTFDVDGKGMTDLITYLAAHRTVIDGTFNLWIGGGASIVGSGASSNQARADSVYLRLIKRLFDAGVPLVAGTDNSTGATYRRELELYERAGIPAARVLQIATIDAARYMGDDRDYGSIAAGKVADLIVVSGKPSEQISALANIETVVRAGRVYKVADLQRATRGATSNSGGDAHYH